MFEDWIIFKPEFKTVNGYKQSLINHALCLHYYSSLPVEECKTILDNEIQPSYAKIKDGIIVGLRYFTPHVRLHISNREFFRKTSYCEKK